MSEPSAATAASASASGLAKSARLLKSAPFLIILPLALIHEEGLAIRSLLPSPPPPSSAAELKEERRNGTAGGARLDDYYADDWFDAGRWADEGSPCFYAENVCHSSFRFLYDESADGGSDGGVGPSHQPRWQLQLRNAAEYLRPGYPTVVEPAFSANGMAHRRCPYSPVANHMVLYSSWNDMLGEFYARSLPGLFAIRHILGGDNDGDGRDKTSSSFSWDTQTQLYLHVNPEKSVMDSHHLFLEPFSSNPLLPFRHLFDRASCHCLRRLFFCGFDARPAEDNANMTALTPGGFVWRGTESGKEWKGDKRGSKAYPALREHLLRTVVRDNAALEDRVVEYRAAALEKLDIPRDEQNEWKLVGLAQRTVRRRWLNFEAALDECNRRLNPRKAVCVELNVEVPTSNAVTQAVSHRAVDMAMGIHGAQLTDAIWMRDGSVVVELLPYAPDGRGMGTWTRTITEPTPLGVIYTESGLYHVGYRLGPWSAPVCREHQDNRTELVQCLRKNRWDGRDFELEDDVVEAAARRFLLSYDRADCGALQRASNESGHVFVLYNVPCREKGEDGTVKVHHYYHKDERGGEPYRR